MLILYGFVALCSLVGISAECGSVKTLQNFDQFRYMGTWYENGMFGDDSMNGCVKYTWFAAPSGEIQMNTFSFWLYGDDYRNVSREVRVPDASKPGQFEITEPLSKKKDNLRILGTDYTSYSVEYVCDNMRSPRIRILTRVPNAPESVIFKGIRIARVNAVTRELYYMTDANCFKQIDSSSNEETTTSEEPESPPPIVENEYEE